MVNGMATNRLLLQDSASGEAAMQWFPMRNAGRFSVLVSAFGNQGLHLFRCNLTFLQYSANIMGKSASLLEDWQVGSPRLSRTALPLQVAAVCYRRQGQSIEFLLVNTNGGGKWTFPKGDPEPSMSHSQAAEREAWEEAGVRGHIEPRHFHLYLHSKGVFWKPPGVREFVIKAFLMEVEMIDGSHEVNRNPTWFTPDEAKKTLAKGREVKYAREMQTVVDRAVEHLVTKEMATR